MNRFLMLVFTLAFLAALAGEARAQGHFMRGDTNRDKKIDLSDGVGVLGYLFLGSTTPPCLDAADIDDTGEIDIADAVNSFGYQFLGGRPPAAPFPRIEADPTPDELGCLGPCVDITGEITASRTLSRNSCYRLVSAVFVREPAVLTIESGTTIIGDSASEGLLVIDRGAKIMAVGEPNDPIVFTSDKPVGQRKRGDWGGVIILGRGDLNVPGKKALAEGLPNSEYGGGDAVDNADSSGRLSYVRIEFGGTEISPNNEVNSLSLFAVGSGTQLDHIQCRYNLDDGVEWFGGAADLKYALCTGISDDSFDYSFSYSGRGQFWVAQQRGDEADRGFEVDNSETEFTAVPLTKPVIANVTLIGDPDTTEGTLSTEGIELRRGAGSNLYNFIVQGFKVAGCDIDDGVTTNNSPANGNLILDYSVFFQNGPGSAVRHFRDGEAGTSEESAANGFAYTTVQFGTTLNPHNILATVSPVVEPYNLAVPNFRPQNDALTPGLDPTTLNSGGSTFFEAAPYRGGVPPSGEDWTQAPWISYSQN